MNRKDRTQQGITRRHFHRLSAAALVTAAAPWVGRTARAEDVLVTEIPENKPMLDGIQFVSESAKEGQQCANCLLFQPGENGVGKCQILPKGVVPEAGWCVSWAAKP